MSNIIYSMDISAKLDSTIYSSVKILESISMRRPIRKLEPIRKRIRSPVWMPSYTLLYNMATSIDDFDEDDMETFNLTVFENLINQITDFFDSPENKLIEYSKSSYNPLNVIYKFGSTNNISDLFVLKITNNSIKYRTNIKIFTDEIVKELFDSAYDYAYDYVNDEKSLETFLDV